MQDRPLFAGRPLDGITVIVSFGPKMPSMYLSSVMENLVIQCMTDPTLRDEPASSPD